MKTKLSIFKEYINSLKAVEAEELVDLLFFRPLGFLFVKLVYPTKLTPNQISIFSLMFGIAAGLAYGFGTENTLILAGIFVALSSILDCADGQLARLKKNGTIFGRLMDGTIDYITTVSVFIGIAIGSTLLVSDLLQWWIIIIIAGISYAIQAGLVDYYRSEYISNKNGKPNFVQNELTEFQDEYVKLNSKGGKKMLQGLLKLYINYSKMQNAGLKQGNINYLEPDEYIKLNKLLVRLWNLNGTAIRTFILIICTFAARLDVFIWYILLFGNSYSIIVWLLQKYSEIKYIKELKATPNRN